MEINTATLKDGQAPARRIGALIAILVICMGCAWQGFGTSLRGRESTA
jgi:hypothetical protein